MESQLEESIKGHAALEERHKELEKANQDMAIEVKASSERVCQIHMQLINLKLNQWAIQQACLFRNSVS